MRFAALLQTSNLICEKADIWRAENIEDHETGWELQVTSNKGRDNANKIFKTCARAEGVQIYRKERRKNGRIIEGMVAAKLHIA